MNILICLIGSNPLPNYIVTKYALLDKTQRHNDWEKIPVPDKVLFLHSKDTEDIADNIIKKLDVKFKSIIYKISLGDNQRSKEYIRKSLINALNKEEKITSIHLNYTGGTKPMSVHSYDTIYKYFKDKDENFELITSDLDPKEYRIQINGKEKYPSNSDLRQFVTLGIKTLLELHGMTFEKSEGKKINSKDLNIDLETFKNNYIKMTEDRNKIKQFREVVSRLDDSKEARKSDELDFINDFNKLCGKELESLSSGTTKFKYMVKFAGGHWLEEYIQNKLMSVKDKYELSEAKRSVEASYDKRKCELDVVVNKGYEMHLFTCTTSSHIQTVKGKAFEGMYRASQLAGDQAKTIIVHLMPRKGTQVSTEEQLKNDLSSFNAKHTTYSICLDDIKDNNKLDKKLSEIFS